MSRAASSERKYSSAKDWADKQGAGFVVPYLDQKVKPVMFKPKAGVMFLDILPYEAGEGNPSAEPGTLHWERTYWTHRSVGANADSLLCLRRSANEPCPICEARVRLQKEADEEKEDLIKELSPKQRQLMNIINLKEPDKGVQLWSISYHLFGKLLQARLRDADEEDDWDKFFFLQGGSTLKVGFAEKSWAGNTFLEVETIDFKSRKTDYEDEILEDVYNLDDILKFTEYDEMKKLFLEIGEGGDEPRRRKPADEDEPPKRRKPPADEDEPPKRRKPADEDEPPARRKPTVDDDEPPRRKPPADEDAPPPKKKPSADDWDDLDNPPAPKRRAPVDEDEPPRRRKPADEDEPPARHKFPAEDEPPRRRKPADEDEPPARRKPPVDDDDPPRVRSGDEPEQRPRRRARG